MLNAQIAKCLAGAAIGLLLVASNASAQASRTWVSGVGDDANPCSRTAPCKTFAGAISKTAAGGEIDVLDPGGFGAVTITKSITIDGGPNAGGILNSGTNGVIINALSTDTIVLRNINIQGFTTGLNGIRLLAGGTLHVENCVISNNSQKGISIESTTPTKLFISDTVIRDNSNGANGGGLFLKPGAGGNVTAMLNRVRFDKNTFGMRVEDNTTTTARDSSFSSNVTHGVVAVSATGVVNLDNCTMSTNVSSGLRSTTGATIRYGRCLIAGNALGLDFLAPGKLVSFTNNEVGGNTTDALAGAPTSTIPLQ